MKAKITKRAVDALMAQATAERRTLYLYDEAVTGFGCYATKGGTAAYFVQFRLGGRGTPSKRMTLAKHGVLTAEQARKTATEKLGEVAAGKDVAQVRRDERRKLASGTFREITERYLSLEGENTRYWQQTRRFIELNAYPVLGSRPITTITKAQIADAIDTTRKRSHSAARLTFAALRPLFKWAHERGIIDANPMAAMRGPEPLKARERILTDAEIKAFWQGASEQSWPFENVFKLLLLTGQRREEVAGARWRELDLDAGAWTIAKERTKNGRTHRLDLSPQAIRLLDPIGENAAPRLAGNTDDLVFSTTGTTPVSGFSKVKARLDVAMCKILNPDLMQQFEDAVAKSAPKTVAGKKAKKETEKELDTRKDAAAKKLGFKSADDLCASILPPWRTHDLRRTAASGMAALGFRPEIIERVLNHVSGAQGGLMGVYQRHDYATERKAALLAWSRHIAALVSEREAAGNVVLLRA
jgi:integrase